MRACASGRATRRTGDRQLRVRRHADRNARASHGAGATPPETPATTLASAAVAITYFADRLRRDPACAARSAPRTFAAMRLPVLTVLLVLWIPTSASATHSGDRDCSDFPNQAAAQQHMDAHAGDPDDLDGSDPDLVACESRPCPCAVPGGNAPPPPAPPPLPATPPPAPPPPPPPAPSPATATATATRTYSGVVVISVVDGDTLKVRLRSGSRRTVRLVGIDTPETRKRGTPVECGGKAATKYITTLVMRRRNGRRVGRPATLQSDPTQGQTDRYGRLLAYAKVSGIDVGKRMVAAGWAMPYVYGGTPFRRSVDYFAAGERAKGRRAGVYGACNGDFHSSD